MRNDQINTELLKAVRRRLPKGTNMANYLSDLLSIGREAIYRRFRGEVPFSLAETFTISQKLGISLDNLSGITLSEDTKFDLNLFRNDNQQEVYKQTLDYYEILFSSLLEEGATEIWDLCNRMPLGLMMQYEHLSKFHLFKRLYQKNSLIPTQRNLIFEELEVEPMLLEKQKTLGSVFSQYPKSMLFWDETLFASIVKEIRFYFEIGALSAESVQIMKGELLQITDAWLDYSTDGQYPNGNKVELYVSSMNFYNSYCYVQTPSEVVSLIKIFDLNTITSRDSRISESMKNWIDSLKKMSVLISQSAQVQRYTFFANQKKIIQTL